jgi:hypothetical protein
MSGVVILGFLLVFACVGIMQGLARAGAEDMSRWQEITLTVVLCLGLLGLGHAMYLACTNPAVSNP